MTPGNESQGLWWRVLVCASSILSLLGSLAVLLSCTISEQASKPARRLLFFLSTCDLCTALIYLGAAAFPVSQDEDESPWCRTQASVGIFFPVASFL